MERQWRDSPRGVALAELAPGASGGRQSASSPMSPASRRPALEDVVALDRGEGRIQRELRGHVIGHLLAHQVHHRGQAHATLSGSAVPPPQLDEFLLPSEAHLREAEMKALGWSEATLFS